jgi:hypothetical protein
MTISRRREQERLFLTRRRRCECAISCGRVADTVVGPPGSKRPGRDKSRWRAMAYQCAIEEQQQAA